MFERAQGVVVILSPACLVPVDHPYQHGHLGNVCLGVACATHGTTANDVRVLLIGCLGAPMLVRILPECGGRDPRHSEMDRMWGLSSHHGAASGLYGHDSLRPSVRVLLPQAPGTPYALPTWSRSRSACAGQCHHQGGCETTECRR